jgi:hypothetical protein
VGYTRMFAITVSCFRFRWPRAPGSWRYRFGPVEGCGGRHLRPGARIR